MTISLHSTQSPVSRAERNKINENWNRIIKGLTNLQIQINILAGGEVDELLERLNQAVNAANIAVQQAIAANDAATQDAINANNTALQTALQTVSVTLADLNVAIANANTATASANDAANNTNQAIQNAKNATQDALNAVTTMQNFVNQLSPKSEYNNEVQYSTNNIVTLKGSSFIALKNTKGNAPPTPPLVVNAHWQLLAEKGGKGDRGDKGERGTDGKDGTGVNIIGELLSESDLPTTGSPGDAYMIHGDLYVWQDNSNTWKNVGPIQGPQGKSAYDLAVENGFEGTMEEWVESLKGIQGPQGPEGPQGPPADLTEVTAQLAEVKTKVDNSWQKGAYNDMDIMNLKAMSVSKAFYIGSDNWKSTTSVEILDFTMPLDNFSGIIKVTYATSGVATLSAGGAEVIYNIGKYGSGIQYSNMVILSMSPKFAEFYKLREAVIYEKSVTVGLIKAPSASNALSVKIEILGTYSEIFDALNSTGASLYDTGEPTYGGYPWTPQTSSFVTKTGNNILAGGLTMGGNLSITKGVPVFEMSVPGSVSSSSASIQLNASSTVDYGLEFRKDNKIYSFIMNHKDVRFMGHDDAWFSIQDLKQSASDVKTNVAAAITDMKVPTSPTATGAQMAANIRKIQSSKSATGRVSPNGSTTVTVRGLAFRPKTISLKMVGVSYTSNGFASYVPKALTSNTWEDTKVFINTAGSTGLDSATTVYDDGFTMQIHNTGTYEEYGYYVTG
ncbi:hypothetical protein ACOMCU_25530 [Lysinibacillus sp. UGB7]|uniref:hypothetical protein n=1 Tax=Lysinibacillus sp. UGB7 TaxID=3411039 RepID=UPI003B7B1A8A